jgi:hypothetical protein
MSERKPVTIRFRFNQDTGQIEEFLIDDQERTAPESYHDRIARAIAGRLFRTPHVVDTSTAAAEAEPPIPTPPEPVPNPPQREGSSQ